MKKFFMICCLLSPLSTLFAGTFKIKAPHSNLFLMSNEVDYKKLVFQSGTKPQKLTVGNVTIDQFDYGVRHKHLNYIGYESGIVSINQIASNAVKISNTEIKAYGWCFSIDGKVPETMPDQTFLTGKEKEILWYYGYAHFKNGKWIAQCKKE